MKILVQVCKQKHVLAYAYKSKPIIDYLKPCSHISQPQSSILPQEHHLYHSILNAVHKGQSQNNTHAANMMTLWHGHPFHSTLWGELTRDGFPPNAAMQYFFVVSLNKIQVQPMDDTFKILKMRHGLRYTNMKLNWQFTANWNCDFGHTGCFFWCTKVGAIPTD